MITQSRFYGELTETLLKNLYNFYDTDNWDTIRFGKKPFSIRELFEKTFNFFLRRYGYCATTVGTLLLNFNRLMASHGKGLSNTYSMLADEYSKRALIEVLAYRLLGYRHMKLWTNTSEYWRVNSIADSLPAKDPKIDSGLDFICLSKIDLNPIGYPMTIFTHPLSIRDQFLLNQYAYKQRTPPVWLCNGEYAIDAGASWGDTALLFAHQVGERGHVYSFEFEPKNLEIIKMNLELNPRLASQITVVDKALWKDSSTILSFNSMGVGTSVCEGASDLIDYQVSSVSIDNFVESLPRVDFIKMDIEGAELPALQGAEKTIRKHRPKLAICLYHSLSDFVDIPAFLASLGLEYDYYIDHTTIHAEETVLFATPRAQMD